MLLAALLLFTSNCTFHKFLNVWGTGMKSCTFWCLSSLQLFFSLSLSHSLPFGSRGRRGRRGTNALVKGRRKWSPLLQKMTVKLKTKPRKKYIAMPNYSAFIGAEPLEQLERHGCDSRENLVHLIRQIYALLAWMSHLLVVWTNSVSQLNWYKSGIIHHS